MFFITQQTSDEVREGALGRRVHDAHRMIDSVTTSSSGTSSPGPIVLFLLLWMARDLEAAAPPLLTSPPLSSRQIQAEESGEENSALLDSPQLRKEKPAFEVGETGSIKKEEKDDLQVNVGEEYSGVAPWAMGESALKLTSRSPVLSGVEKEQAPIATCPQSDKPLNPLVPWNCGRESLIQA
ncbi:unnamed protein product [Spirodela intermedia]|uniref:Uncharacterized protein n=1 Tax=Spirodela intermedia TaxID=51605 RepID=A0A7I8K599_SPIIN|nr:unnamed protein product [Spirodela intermedia]